MPVLAVFEQPNLDERTYASMLQQLMPVLRSAKGFISHAGGRARRRDAHHRDLGVRGGQPEFFQREPEAESPARGCT